MEPANVDEKGADAGPTSSRNSNDNQSTARGVVALSPAQLLAITDNAAEEDAAAGLSNDENDEDRQSLPKQDKIRTPINQDTASKRESGSSSKIEGTAATGGGASASSGRPLANGSDVSSTPGAHRVVPGGGNNNGDSNETAIAEDSEQGFTRTTTAEQEAITATVVDADQYEAQIRREILSEAVMAQIVDGNGDDDDPHNVADKPTSSSGSIKEDSAQPQTRKGLVFVVITVVAIVLGATLLGVLIREEEDDDPRNIQQVTTVPVEERDIPPSWWIEVSPGISKQASPQQQAYVWMVENDKANMDLSQPPTISSFWRTYALTTFYYATGGANWTRDDDWLDPDIFSCDWYPGNMCDPTTDNDTRNLRGLQKSVLKRITLPNNGLVGELPPELSLLTDLELLDVSFNKLEGNLRGVAGDMFINGLLDLRLEGNSFTDRIPPRVCNGFANSAQPQNGTFAMDCLETVTGAEDWEVRCPCCNLCCSVDGLECQEINEEKPGTT